MGLLAVWLVIEVIVGFISSDSPPAFFTDFFTGCFVSSALTSPAASVDFEIPGFNSSFGASVFGIGGLDDLWPLERAGRGFA